MFPFYRLIALAVKFLQGLVLEEIPAKFFLLLFLFTTLQGTSLHSILIELKFP